MVACGKGVGMTLTKTICRYCKNGGCYGGPYAPRPARCGDCQGTGELWLDEDGNQYEPGTELATDGVEHFDPDSCKDWLDGDEYFDRDDCKDWMDREGTGPNGHHVWMTELE